MSEELLIDLAAFNAAYRDLVPFNAALGMRIVEASTSPPVAVVELAWDERLVGNPETGVLHGGVITALLDTAGGASVYLSIKRPLPIATLDLRIDYLKPATPGQVVRARAECFRTTRNVAFVRALAYHHQPEDPIATASGTFMLSTRGRAVTDPSAVVAKGEPP